MFSCIWIFSNAVADGIRYYQSESPLLKGVEGTIKFTKRINDLFDCLNRKLPREGIRSDSKDIAVSIAIKSLITSIQ